MRCGGNTQETFLGTCLQTGLRLSATLEPVSLFLFSTFVVVCVLGEKHIATLMFVYLCGAGEGVCLLLCCAQELLVDTGIAEKKKCQKRNRSRIQMRGHRPSRAHYAITKKKAQKIEFPSLSFSISLRRINRQHGANPCSSCSRFDLVMVVCTCEAVILEIVVGKYPNRSVHEGPKDRRIEKKRK